MSEPELVTFLKESGLLLWRVLVLVELLHIASKMP